MSLDRRDHCRTRPLIPGRRVLPAACRAAFLLPLFVLAPGALAQTAATFSFVSEYSLRGLSLSSGQAVPQLRIDQDSSDGWYWGAFGSRVALRASPASALAIAYGGYARRLPSGLGWDAGVSRVVFLRDGRNNYLEVYAGISSDRASARLSLSPDYYGEGRTAYAEVNGDWPLGERWRLTGHAGLLHWLQAYGGAARNRIDLRAGLAAEIGDLSLEIGLQARQRDPGLGASRARALFASASLGF